MNYYEKIIQEKQNGNLFLEKLRTKSFRSADELERAIKSYVAGGRVISDDADGFTVEAIDDDGKHTYKIYLREDGGTSERVTVERVVKLNSQEGKENAYAKLVKKLSDFDIYEDAEGYFMRVKDGKVIKGGYLSIRDAETDGHRAKSASKDNARYTTLKLIRTEKYKGCEINVSESKSPYEDSPVYVYNAHDRQMKIFVSGIAGSEAEAITKAKREIDIKANSKEEGYYAKLAEEKAEKKNFGDETLIEKKSFGEYWYSIHQTKNKMILRVYTPYGMYYIDDIRDLADGRNEAQRTIDIVKKAGKYV